MFPRPPAPVCTSVWLCLSIVLIPSVSLCVFLSQAPPPSLRPRSPGVGGSSGVSSAVCAAETQTLQRSTTTPRYWWRKMEPSQK